MGSLRSALEELLHDDPSARTYDELRSDVAEISAAIGVLTQQVAARTHQVATRGDFGIEGFVNITSWLARSPTSITVRPGAWCRLVKGWPSIRNWTDGSPPPAAHFAACRYSLGRPQPIPTSTTETRRCSFASPTISA